MSVDELRWDPPGPGPWRQDRAHNPVCVTALLQELVPPGFERGMRETLAAFGILLDSMAMRFVNGFLYLQPQPFDMPGPDGPKDPDWIGAEFGRRLGVAQAAMEERIWRETMREWDEELKPVSQARHVALGSVDLQSLDDAQLRDHLEAVIAHVSEMAYQHHRFNAHAMIPVGDFLLQTATWVQRPPMSMFGVFGGYSPISNVSPPEMQAALAAVRANADSEALLRGDGDPAEVIAQLTAEHPEVADYVAGIHFRLLEGFDSTNLTIGERPECIRGRLRAALDVDHDVARDRADAFAAELRAATPEDHRDAFDGLLEEARLVYRLRDERGMFSDISAVGLLRLALLEFGRRLEARGRVKLPEDVLDATRAELDSLFDGGATPAAEELHQRALDRLDRTLAGSPRFLGDEPPPPPPVDMLPPPLARVMGGLGFTIEGVFNELDEPVGDASLIGGICGASGVYEGRAKLIGSIDDLFDLEQGDVLVAPTTGEAFNSMLYLVGAIVTDHGSYASHPAIVSREMGIPAVVGTVNGSRRIPDGSRVRVDGTAGTVTIL